MEDIDDATLNTILALHIQDLTEIGGPQHEAGIEQTDGAMAAELYRQELQDAVTGLRDHRLRETRSIEDDHALLSCIACGEHGSWELSRLPCDHHYCDQCIARLFDSAMKDESLFPPRCCGKHIPFESVEHLFDEEYESVFEERRIELSAENRIYCAKPECSLFIRADRVEAGKAICRACSTETCVYCKSTAHEGECSQDPAVTSLMALAAAEGYRQCYRCQRLVELTFGCNHITYSTITCRLLNELADLSPAVVAVPNSAMSAVVDLGKIAPVLCSTRIDFLREHSTLSTGTVHKRQGQTTMPKSDKQSRIYVTIIPAFTTV
ncbi:MAG: hypothetical protein LQ338_006183 [Usnochroma carphineum]|nr:MAG: hypothetical protein LQ338_006183 [Usnochroma carphineum]